jgi:aspartate-semialdehyde dehydrogenase
VQYSGDKKYRVAILGATGVVGQQFVSILQERKFPVSELKLLASDRSAGGKISFNGEEIVVEEATAHSFEDTEIALFSAAPISPVLCTDCCQTGSSGYRQQRCLPYDPRVPLLYRINPEDIAKHHGIMPIQTVNHSDGSSTVSVHKVNPIKRIIVTTFQSVPAPAKQL